MRSGTIDTSLGAQPNAAHHAVRALAARSRVHRLVTQNVDDLHTRAGNPDVIKLHGNIGRVRCIGCGERHTRTAVQRMLEAANPEFVGYTAAPCRMATRHIEDLDFGRVRSARLHALRRRAKAGCGVLRRERAARTCPGRGAFAR